jgi:hypothetical protein
MVGNFVARAAAHRAVVDTAEAYRGRATNATRAAMWPMFAACAARLHYVRSNRKRAWAELRKRRRWAISDKVQRNKA